MVIRYGSTKTWNPESGIRNPETETETEAETETETEYGICERRQTSFESSEASFI